MRKSIGWPKWSANFSKASSLKLHDGVADQE
jgi:hypothetical protein